MDNPVHWKIRILNNELHALDHVCETIDIFKKWYVENCMKNDESIVKSYFLSTPADMFVTLGIEGVTKYCRKAHECRNGCICEKEGE